jgi:alpha-glucosidase (family GH31 glycosyl hydrolase)
MRLVGVGLLLLALSGYAQQGQPAGATANRTEAPVEGLERRDASSISFSATAATHALLHDFSFNGDAVSTGKLHFHTIAPGIVEITSVAYATGDWEFQIDDSAAGYYGLGEHANALNQSHTILHNLARRVTGPRGSTTAKPVPFFMSTTGYGLWIDTTGDATFDLNATDEKHLLITATASKLRLVLFSGPGFPSILAHFTEVAGRAPLPPVGVFAPWIGRDVYANDVEMQSDTARLRALGVPASTAPVGNQNISFLRGSECEASFAEESGLPSLLREGLNAGMSGMALWAPAMELPRQGETLPPAVLQRWAEFAAFSPAMVWHGATGAMPWDYGDGAMATYRRYALVHMSLFPYRMRAAQEAVKTGMPLMRSLALVAQDDLQARSATDEYLFGPDMLVAPVLHEGTQRAVTLPAGEWVNYWTGGQVAGGKTIVVEASLEEIPVYARAGAVIAKIPDDVMTLVPQAESGNAEIKDPDDRRVYELMPALSGAAVAQTDFEERALTRSANSFKIEGKDAKVTVRWRFGQVTSATVNGASVRVQRRTDGPFVEFSHAVSSVVEWH